MIRDEIILACRKELSFCLSQKGMPSEAKDDLIHELVYRIADEKTSSELCGPDFVPWSER